jgi:hypothetical protein
MYIMGLRDHRSYDRNASAEYASDSHLLGLQQVPPCLYVAYCLLGDGAYIGISEDPSGSLTCRKPAVISPKFCDSSFKLIFPLVVIPAPSYLLTLWAALYLEKTYATERDGGSRWTR